MKNLAIFLFICLSLNAKAIDDLNEVPAMLHVAKTYWDVTTMRSTPRTDCERRFELSKSIWETKALREGINAQVAASLDREMSLDDITRDPVIFRKDPILRLLRKNRYSINYSLRSPTLLHVPARYGEREGCRDYEILSHQVVTKGEATCREVKFARTSNHEQFYYMTYCAGSDEVYVNYAQNNEFEIIENSAECNQAANQPE